MKETDRDTLRYIGRVSGKSKVYIVVLLTVQMVLGLSSVFYALLLREVIDRAVGRERNEIGRTLLFLVLLVLFQIMLRALVRFFRELANASFENAFKMRQFSVLLSKDYGAVTASHSGEWLNRLTSDTAVIAEGLSTILPGMAEMVTKMCGACVMILILEKRFGMILIPGGLILAALTYFFRKRLKKLHKIVQEADGKLRVFLQEHLESLVIVKSYAKEEQTVAKAREKMEEHKDARMRRNHFSNICNVGFAACMNGAYLLGVAYGAYGICSGTVSYGTLTALLQLIGQIQAPFANITGYLPKYYAMIASAERIMEAEELTKDGEAETTKENEALTFRELGLRDASFSYQGGERGETDVFEHFDLSVRSGEFVAFTGLSGCGKSTVLKLLMSLYPLTAGEKYVLTAGGEVPLDASRRGLFAYVPQGNLLMSGTIREVVTFAENGAGTEGSAPEESSAGRLEKALEIACVTDYISDLPKGVDTVLGERGAGLSEGQMQRIAIARAVYSARPVLLLDESTSALDEQTEKRLLLNLKTMTDKTVIIVTHRPAALEICDRQVDFYDGRGVEHEAK